MDKKDNPYKVYIEMYCKNCEWFSLKTDDLSTAQYKIMKKCIDKCAIVRMAINTEPTKIETKIETKCPRGFLHCDPMMMKCDIESLPSCHLHKAFMKNKGKKK